MSNLGYQFYSRQDEFRYLIQNGFAVSHKEIEAAFSIDSASRLEFNVEYPGLLIGLGYLFPKEANNDAQYNLGFSFDHTSGLPYLPGSSVKGVLRSVFPKSGEDTSRIQFIQAMTGRELDYNEIKKIEITYFGPRTHEVETRSGKKSQDTFYDSYILHTGDSYILDEYITPHGDDPTKNPVPIKMIKIAPENRLVVQICFSADESLLTQEERKNLFTGILEFTGAGAKTNVGFGHLSSIG